MKKEIFEAIYCNLLLASVIKRLEYANSKNTVLVPGKKEDSLKFKEHCDKDLTLLDMALSYLETKMGENEDFKKKTRIKIELDPLYNIIEERISKGNEKLIH